MTKNKKILLIAGVAVLVVCLALVLAFCGIGGGQEDTTSTDDATAGESLTYTVTVKSQGGMAIPEVGIYVYEDATQEELVWFDKTDAEGKMSFTDAARDTYVAVLSDVPTGYQVEEYYPLTGEQTEIVLAAGQMTDADVEELTYKLGDMMMDFTVTGTDGTEYKLSELLQQKKAVVLNFWYVECGPCKAEFPFLQEAYEKYSDDVAVLAMNPINTAEDIAAFQKENGYTFPMLSCGSEWEKIMQITAYPTTVVIDRHGNISLIHKGSVDSAKTFEDTFAYFAAEEYEQKLITDITELLTEEEEGSKENPVEIGGQSVFEVTVEPGKEVYTDVYKALGMYMQIQGKDFYVLYNGNKYTPDSNGIVGFVITTGDTFTPANFGIGNTGTEQQTYKVALSNLAGTLNNPYTLKLGEFTTKIAAGNEQGVYYVYDAKESGTLTVQCLSSSSGVDYGYTLYNTGTMAVRTLEADGSTDGGVPTLSVVVNKGDRVQFIASTLPDSSHAYPGGTFKFKASFVAGAGTDQDKVELVNYAVNVTDEAGQPMVNVNFSTEVDGETRYFATDATGAAVAALPKGNYTFKMIVPDGYTAEKTEFALTEAAPTAQIQLKKVVIQNADYSVTVLDPEGAPVKDVLVFIGDDLFAVTDASGVASVNLPVGTYLAEIAELPFGYALEETMVAFPEGQTALTVTLAYAPGSAKLPYQITVTPYTTEETEENTAYFYALYYTGAPELKLEGAGGYVIYNGTTYGPDSSGVITVQLTQATPAEPATLVIGNGGTEPQAYTLTLVYADDGDPDDTDPTDPSQTDPSETDPTQPSQTDPTQPSETDPTQPSETDPTEPEETEPTEPTEPELPAKMTYSVTILGPDGEPVSGVRVQIKKGLSTKATGNTGADGTYSKQLATDDYTVVLKFSSGSYYYDESSLVLSGRKPDLTVNLAAEPSSDDVTKHWFVNSAPLFNLYEGNTHLSLSTGKSYYSAEKGGNCFFVFVPTQAGTFRVSLDNTEVELSDWNTTNFPQLQKNASENEDNALYFSIQENQVGNVEYVLGVKVVEGITDVAMQITRVGEPAFDISAQPWSTDWQSAYVPSAFTLHTGGKTLTYLDLTARTDSCKVVYSETDGYYHLNSATGPILYVNLGTSAPYVSFHKMIMGDGTAGGAPLRSYFYDENGAFVKKEDYTECMISYLNCMDTATGVYPLTQDLIHMIQNGGANWWDVNKPTYMFKDADGENDLTINTEIAWMFAVCYLK